MRAPSLLVSLASAGVILLASAVRAQAPPQIVSPNYARAYHHFLTSTSSYRTLESSTPGYAAVHVSPYGSWGYYVEPGYEEQRITPRGYERYQRIPGYGGYSWTPVLPVLPVRTDAPGYYVPGYADPYAGSPGFAEP